MKELTEDDVDKNIRQFIDYLEKNDALQLRTLSNNLIEVAMSTEDQRVVDLSLISYTFSKMITKPHLVETKDYENFKKKLISVFIKQMEKNDTKKEMAHMLDDTIDLIIDFDQNEGNYAINIIEQARIKQASRLYALGLSLSRAAEITNVNKNELLNYVGLTKIHERPFTQSKKITERYKIAKQVLS